MNYRFPIAIALLLFVSACATREIPENFDYGSVTNGKYINDFFGMEVTLPTDWVVQSQEQMQELTKQGQELVAGDNENLKSAIKAAEVTTANLFGAYQFELGSDVEYNPSIMMVAENVKLMPGLNNGADYLAQARKLLAQSNFKYDYLDEDFEKEIINGQEFYKMDAAVTFMGTNIKQTYYSTIHQGFTVNAIISYSNNEQKAVLIKAVNTITFKK